MSSVICCCPVVESSLSSVEMKTRSEPSKLCFSSLLRFRQAHFESVLMLIIRCKKQTSPPPTCHSELH